MKNAMIFAFAVGFGWAFGKNVGDITGTAFAGAVANRLTETEWFKKIKADVEENRDREDCIEL